MNDLKGFDILATDGEIGDVEELYFDDEQWAVRYIVVNNGSWLSGRQVLISPFSVTQVDRDNRKLHLCLTQDRVEKSPNIDTHNWLPGKKVIVSPRWISLIDWAQGKVHVNLSRERVKQSPEYESSQLISREYETQLYRHHGQTGYWLN